MTTEKQDTAFASAKNDGRGRSDRDVDDNAKPEGEHDAPREIGGRDGPDPTRYGDWEKGGRCIDF